MDARARHALALYTNISSNCDRKLKATSGSGTMLGLISLGVIGKQLFGTRAIYKKIGAGSSCCCSPILWSSYSQPDFSLQMRSKQIRKKPSLPSLWWCQASATPFVIRAKKSATNKPLKKKSEIVMGIYYFHA